MAKSIQQKIRNIPNKPGVYLFKNAQGEILYIGKAANLHSRVAQYFAKNDDGRPQIPFLMREVVTFETIVTDNEVESLLLENNLIKKYKPHYNIKLRDDKNYVFIKIDFDTEIPQIYTVRNPDSKNAKYFGPYSSSVKVRETLHLVRKIFPYCANKKVGTRPCFYYFLHRCPGVCIGKISLEEYKESIKKIAFFIAGNISETKKEIKASMAVAAKAKRFETAAQLRDNLQALEVVEERQKIILAQRINWDFISYFQTADKTAVNVFVLRNGRMSDRKNFILDDTSNKNGAEIMEAFMEKYYGDIASLHSLSRADGLNKGGLETQSDLPKEIFVEELPNNVTILKKLLSSQRIKISKPSRGKKANLIKLGIDNAKEYFESWSMDQATELSRTTLALSELQKTLHITNTLARIECFDISNIQGTNSVASMVVFENGKPKKSEYRKFKIRQDGMPNDFAMMREALSRRFQNAHSSGDGERWQLPDLLVIDGGKGQLGVAVAVLKERSLNIPVIGLAKREEEIFIPSMGKPILLPKSNYALQLLQRIRDEAHRFGITFHRQLRSKQSYKSVLDTVSGIGPKKKKLLLKKYGTLSNIKNTPREELNNLIGTTATTELLRNI